MKKLKAYIFGKENTGKSELVRKLHAADYVNQLERKYIPTKNACLSYLMIHTEENEGEIQIELCDMPGSKYSKASVNSSAAKSNFGLYCIDLSMDINALQIKQVKEDIKLFQKINPYAKLILVGTKSDKALAHSLKTAHEQLADIKFHEVINTNTRTMDGCKELYELLATESKKKLLPNPDDFFEFFNVVNPIIKARNRCGEDSSLYAALNNLNEQAKEQSFNIIEALGHQAEKLLNNLEDHSITDKTASINAFLEQGTQLLRGENYILNSAILSVAITAVVTFVAGLIGFGIGFALGLWSGPGAFFTAVIAGNACATSIVGGASTMGLCTFAYTSFILFRAPPLLQAVEGVAQQAHEENATLNTPLQL